MKSVTFTLAFFFISSLSFAQNTEIDTVISILKGVWKWETYEGGLAGLPPTPANGNYHLVVNQDGGMINTADIYLNSYLDTSVQFSQTVSINIDTQNVWMRYNFSPGLLYIILGLNDTTPVDFRILTNDTIQFTHTRISDDFTYTFVREMPTVSVLTGGDYLWVSEIGYFLNGYRMHSYHCNTEGFIGGLTLAVFDSATINPWVSIYPDDVILDTGFSYNPVDKNFFSILCHPFENNAFDFPTYDSTWQNRIINFINAIPNGNYVLVYSVRYAYYSGLIQNLVNSFKNLGSSKINSLVSFGSITNSNNLTPWVFFVKKGDLTTVVEQAGDSASAVINTSISFNCAWKPGTAGIPTTVEELEYGVNPNETITIYPNPSSGVIYINYSSVEVEKITVMNLIGQELEVIKTDKSGNISIRTTTFQNGIFFFIFKTNEGIVARKIVIKN